MVPDRFGLRQFVDPVDGVAAGVIDIFLVLLHPAHVFLERHHLFLAGGIVQQQILQDVLVHTVVLVDAVFELQAEVLEEFFVLFPVVFEHGFQLGMDFFLHALGNQLELAVVLQRLARNVQRQVLRIHQPAHKAEIIRQQVGALVHNQHAVRVKLKPFLIVAGVKVERRVRGDVHQRVERHRALRVHVDGFGRIVIIGKLVLVELVVLLLRDFVLVLPPQGDHAVQGLVFRIGLVLVLAVFFQAALLHVHFNRVADVVGVFLHQRLQGIGIRKLAVLLVVGVRLQLQNHFRAAVFFVARLHAVPFRSGGFPLPRLVAPERAAAHRDMAAYHKRGIKPHPELADDFHIFRAVLLLAVFLLHVVLKVEGAALRDGAEVVLQLLFRHAAAVVGNRQGMFFLVRKNPDHEIVAVQSGFAVRQGLVVQLVNRVARVGNQFAQKNFLMRINGVDHQIQKTFGFRFKLLQRHGHVSSAKRISTQLSQVLILIVYPPPKKCKGRIVNFLLPRRLRAAPRSLWEHSRGRP